MGAHLCRVASLCQGVGPCVFSVAFNRAVHYDAGGYALSGPDQVIHGKASTEQT